MHIIIIGNYPLDKVESMHRFARLLHFKFDEAGVSSEIWQPSVFFGHLYKSNRASKWLGYVDKFLIFPVILYWRMLNRDFSKDQIRFHVCDHGNAPYLRYLPIDRTVITCHDVHAIRGALGHSDSYTPASSLGKLFQKWILQNLCQSKYLIAVSHHTLKQLREITPASNNLQNARDWRIVHNGLNASFGLMSVVEQHSRLTTAGMNPETRFILHVGSNSLRKNRRLLLQMLKALKGKWNGKICFAGDSADSSLIGYAEFLGLRDSIVSVANPDHTTLMALYNAAEIFVFPSFSEGFGWPLIEAQACGVPVLASNVEPLPEVGGDGAIYLDPHEPEAFARAFLMFKNETFRMLMIRKGLENAKRFNSQNMIAAYLHFHRHNAPEPAVCALEEQL